ncbi:hypothetical protein ULMS_26970 [Patiriisocius marinistellae]|uniref:Uncharacterized protein n=1 Tax=Patiriisocius marinistellae TaxID=2494560 RepID=A0A5J4G2U0_9FLAO|nr:hypothetical protein ULMS_26970 [Patiriisocius marinistellae]
MALIVDVSLIPVSEILGGKKPLLLELISSIAPGLGFVVLIPTCPIVFKVMNIKKKVRKYFMIYKCFENAKILVIKD